jgi:rhodanese-related sulfurtransferase
MATSESASTTVEALLAGARAQLERLSPQSALSASRHGAALIDIRSEAQIRRDGLVPDAVAIPRNVLEWRLDPASPDRDPELGRLGRRVIVICDEGYQSSLAAAALRGFGLDATDVIGGAQAWRAAGLPLVRA